MSAQVLTMGRIIHANDEIEALLGYRRQELINRNITFIIPNIIAQYHDGFIKRYIETGV
jgi:PAS domain S-box-containing protein